MDGFSGLYIGSSEIISGSSQVDSNVLGVFLTSGYFMYESSEGYPVFEQV
jgi:hypothetical protein